MYGGREYLWELNNNVPILIELLLRLVRRGYTFDQLLQQTGSDWLFLVAVFTVANVEQHTVQRFIDTMRPGVYRKYCTYCSIFEPIVKRNLQELKERHDLAQTISSKETPAAQSSTIAEPIEIVNEIAHMGTIRLPNKKRSVSELYKNEDKSTNDHSFISNNKINEMSENAPQNRKIRKETLSDEQYVAMSDEIHNANEAGSNVPANEKEQPPIDGNNKPSCDSKHSNNNANSEDELKNKNYFEVQTGDDETRSPSITKKDLQVRFVEKDSINTMKMEISNNGMVASVDRGLFNSMEDSDNNDIIKSTKDSSNFNDACSPYVTINSSSIGNDDNATETHSDALNIIEMHDTINEDNLKNKIQDTVEETNTTKNMVEDECEQKIKQGDSNTVLGTLNKADSKDDVFCSITTEFLKSEFKCYKNSLLSYMNIILTTNTFPVRLEMIYCLDQLRYAELALETLETSTSNGELRILYTDMRRNMYELNRKVNINKMENVEQAMKIRENTKWLEKLELDPFMTPGQMAATGDKLEELAKMEAFESEIPKIKAFLEDLRIIDGVKRRFGDGERSFTEELTLKAHLAAQRKKRLDREAEEIEIFLNKVVPFFDAQRERRYALITESKALEELLEGYNFEELDQIM